MKGNSRERKGKDRGKGREKGERERLVTEVRREEQVDGRGMRVCGGGREGRG